MAMRRVAKKYAKSLPAYLQANWGGSEFYTAGQVRAALDHRHLRGRYVAVAYAAFLSEADYLEVAAELPLTIAYDVAREAFRRAGGPQWSAYKQNPITNEQAANRYFGGT
jgi:hypothetical protein